MAIVINEVECCEGVALVEDSLLSGNKFNLIQSVTYNVEGNPKASVLGTVPYSRGPLRVAKQEIVDTLRHVKAELEMQNIFVACLVKDDGNTNPSMRQLIPLDFYIIPCVAHVQCNSVRRVVSANIMTYNGLIIVNVARLKVLFQVNNAMNDDEKLQVANFWRHLVKYSRRTVFQTLALLRNSGVYDFHAQSKRFLLNCAWRARLVPHIPHLDIYLTLLVNVQRVQQLLELRMSDENANELIRLANYLDLVLLDGVSFAKLTQCINFFVQLFRVSRLPYIPLSLSVVVGYYFKDYVRMLCKSNLMPSLSEYMEIFQQWSERPFETKFYSEFACMQLEVEPPLRVLQDIFTGRFARLVNAWQPLNNNRYLRMIKMFPALIHEDDDDDLRACIALLRQAQALRHILVPHQFMQQHEGLLRKLVKIFQFDNLDKFKVAV